MNIIDIDLNNLENILLYNFTIFDNNLYNIQQLLLINNSYIRHAINNILISNNDLLLDIIIYIKMKKINIIFINKYYTKLFDKWQEYNNTRNNIYIYIKNCISKSNLIIRYNNIGCIIILSKMLKDIPNKYKDNYGKILNYDIAKYHINLNTKEVYNISISTQLFDYRNDNNFNLLCYAIMKCAKSYKNIFTNTLNENQNIELIKINHKIYEYIPLKLKTNEIILESVICDTLRDYNMIPIKKLSNATIENLIININNNISLDYNKNNNKNKKFVYFVLSYISNYPIGIDCIKHNLNNNKLLTKCYKLLEPYKLYNYKIFSYDYKLNQYNKYPCYNESYLNINYDKMRIERNIININNNISEQNMCILYKYIDEYNTMLNSSNKLYKHPITNNKWSYNECRNFIHYYTKSSCIILHEVNIILELNVNIDNDYKYNKYLQDLYFPLYNKILYHQDLVAEMIL